MATQIFAEGTQEERGENARLSAFVGAIAVGDLGMLKLFQKVLIAARIFTSQ